MSWLDIDASHGEGGGQLTRLALALSAITGRPIRLHGIRARRARPGLAAQHLAALRAVAALCGGRLEGDALGSLEVGFRPGVIRGGQFSIDVGTAGSISLVLQAVLPVALRAEGPCRLRISGGTDVKLAPPFDYLRLVMLPWLADLGAEMCIRSVRHGYYPRGGGELVLDVTPSPYLRPLVAESRGTVQEIRGRAHVAHLPMHIAERMAAAARAQLAGFAPVRIDTEVLGDAQASGMGGALVLAAEAPPGRLGSAVVAQRGVTAERLGEEAGRSLSMDLASGAALDVHGADQLLVYAALARGESRFTVREVSLHARTAMWLIEHCLPVRFAVEHHTGIDRVRLLRA